MNYAETIDNIVKFSIKENTLNKDSILFKNIKPEAMGMSGKITRMILNNICSGNNVSYMEVGLASGSTFSSAIFENGKENNHFLGFDTFTGTKNKIIEGGGRYEIKDKFYENLKNFNTLKTSKVKIVEDNFFNVNLVDLFDKEKLQKINVYFYDAEHTQNSTYHAIVHAYDVLSDVFVYIVDDWNDNNVRQGCYQSILETGLNIDYYSAHHSFAGDDLYTCANKKTWRFEDIDPVDDFGDYKTFYNGIGIFVLSKNKNSFFELVKSKKFQDRNFLLSQKSSESIFLKQPKYDKKEIQWNVK